jgi:hypothetical protein
MDVSQAPCRNCTLGHVRYDHIDWKKGTPYEGNHTGCRIVGCGCQSFGELTTVMSITLLAELTHKMRDPGEWWD